ncbi:MAG: hypothetical protein M0006_12880 [Magnetospirillum sp.]|nr:hypothetical protein [Magnetospirillum sp.]
MTLGLPKRWALLAACVLLANLAACAEDPPPAGPAATGPAAAGPAKAVGQPAPAAAADPASARAKPAMPVIAVTDLTYEDRVSSYFTYGQTQNTVSSQSGMGGGTFDSQNSTVSASGEITTIERGELHKFTADIKGALIKSGMFRVVQGRPWTSVDTTVSTATCLPPNCDGSPKTYSETVTIYDIIDRIKKGFYDGADYVLFGTISSIDSRNDAVPIQATNAVNHTLSMELLVDFSLIDTRTYQVTAGFSAMGEGSDSRLTNMPGTVVTLSPARVMQDVSRSLSDAVLTEIQNQFPQGQNAAPPGGAASDADTGKVTTYR